MGEFELIRHYFAAAPCAQAGDGVALGIGDDCALLALPAGEQLAVSTDTLVAGVHFPASVTRCCSASARWRWPPVTWRMGATPIAFTLALTLPEVRADWLQAYAQGLSRMALHCGLSLVGGRYHARAVEPDHDRFRTGASGPGPDPQRCAAR
ncbi:hypothetical protein G3435_14875 [Pseudomonas sp. MAFF212428]|uniref:PurM-like N-terminal domain-containing protein n=1 Tax=Pseudomonas brassicae TaxID=2708063 RepID=A0A6M0CTX0_9PSED|nr:hypothetical protein [Pseudomonas brassicae]